MTTHKMIIAAATGPDLLVAEISEAQRDAILKFIHGEPLPEDGGGNGGNGCLKIASGKVTYSGGVLLRDAPGTGNRIGALYAGSVFDVVERAGPDWLRMTAYVTARPDLVEVT